MRLPFQKKAESERRPREPVGVESEDAVAAARTVARRRLIGAVVLLAIGVIGFPMLFETRPRPLPANVPIITSQDESTRAAAPSGRERVASASAVQGESSPAPPPPAAPPVPVPAAAPTVASAPAPAVSASATPVPSPAASPASSSSSPRAAATPAPVAKPPPPTTPTPAAPRPAPVLPPAPAPAPAKPPPPAEVHEEGRFVVQVGAYSDAGTLRETRQKVEKLGLKTYTQVIDSDGGKRTRVRVGPFATRTEAQSAVAKLKAAGLPANLIAL